MNIIEEMRNEAASLRAVSPYDYGPTADTIEDWANRLAGSGALVPVKVGDPVALDCVKTNCIAVNGKVYMCTWDIDWCGVADTTPYLDQVIRDYDEATLIVQPVRLVPLEEADV